MTPPKTLKDKLAAVKRWSRAEIYLDCVDRLDGPKRFASEDDYDALLRALDVALRQRNRYYGHVPMSADVPNLNDSDAEILAAYEGKGE